MMAQSRSIFSRVSRRSEVRVPTMDGPLKPNNALDEARIAYAVAAPDNLVDTPETVIFSSGLEIYSLPQAGDEPVRVRGVQEAVTCLAWNAEFGLAIGCAGCGIELHGGTFDGLQIPDLGGAPFVCPTAAIFDGDCLIVASGSAVRSPERWKADLMEKGGTGSVWRINLRSGKREKLVDGLGYPSGILLNSDQSIIVSEAWKHRLIRISGRATEIVCDDLPGYPGRIASMASSDGYWLSLFAPRLQLVEFVLKEDRYRQRMIEDVPEEYWMAPALRSGNSFLEPLQGGAVKQLGDLKPWAPSRSYGLVVGLDHAFNPTMSFHSRATGRMHGITSIIEKNGKLLATSKGGNSIISLDLQPEEAVRD